MLKNNTKRGQAAFHILGSLLHPLVRAQAAGLPDTSSLDWPKEGLSVSNPPPPGPASIQQLLVGAEVRSCEKVSLCSTLLLVREVSSRVGLKLLLDSTSARV